LNPAASAAGTVGVLVVGHGSREARANLDFETLVAAFRERLGARVDEVAHGYVELAAPALGDALAALAARHGTVVVLPLFLFLVGHAKNDLPIALARARAGHPGVRFVAGRELGIHTLLLDLLFERAVAALGAPGEGGPEAARTVALVVGRGSSDPDANAEACKLVRLFGEGRGFSAVLPAFAGITTPRLGEALEAAARGRPGRILVVPHLLFAGRLVDRIREEAADFGTRYPWIRTSVAEPLGPDPRLCTILQERLDQALAGGGALPCDTCQYRVPVAGVAANVGGLRALLWSVRHGYTHTQAAPHRHAHRPLARHVLVCGNVDCAAAGSLALIESLRRLVKQAGRLHDIRVTRTSCMGRCGEGPTVAVYPDGVWYRAVHESDAEDLVREHLLADRLVARLVDNIMQ
jgi:sirohydrochlorin cobaltochelatase